MDWEVPAGAYLDGSGMRPMRGLESSQQTKERHDVWWIQAKQDWTNNYLMCVCVPGFVGIKRLVTFPAWRFLNQSCEAPFLPPLTCVVLACAFPRPTGFWENEAKSWPLRKPCFLQYMAADAQLSKEMRASMASHRNWPVFVPHTAEALLTWWPEIYVMYTTPTLVMMKLKGP